MWSAARVGAAARQLPSPRGLAAGTSLPAAPCRRRQHSAPRRGLPIDAMPTPGDLPGTPSAARLHEYVDMRHRQLGPVFRDRIGPVSAVFVADPDEMRRTFGLEGKYPMHVLPEPWVHYNQLFGVKRGLFFMDGADWLKMRRLMNPLMLRTDQGDIFFSACQHVAESLVSKWKAGGSQVIDDLESQLYKWSLDTVIAVLMGPLYETHAPKWNDEVEYLAHNIHKVFLETGNMSLISAKDAQEGQLPVWKRFITTVDASLNTARSLVLQMIPLCTGESSGLLKGMIEGGMSEEDIIKVVIDFIIAAGDTTALSLQWTLYLLAENPLTQGQVAAELTQETDILQSALVRGVVREALRLYPVAPFLTRIMPESCVIGGYELPPKELVLLSLFTSGRNAKNFPEPERFWPERWLRTSHSTNEVTHGSYKAVHNPHASMPFAMGARSCIGKKLAETQMITTLATILRDFKIELLNTENIDMVLRMVAVPSIPLKLGLQPRTQTTL